MRINWFKDENHLVYINGATQLTELERTRFNLSTLKLTYAQAIAEYRRCEDSKLGRLIAARELPMLERAWGMLGKLGY